MRWLPLLVLLGACVGPPWNASQLLLDGKHRVAEALGDELAADDFDRELVPQIPPPGALRPCCAFGMDLTVRWIGVPVFFMPNMTELKALGRHQYDNGMLTLQSNGKFFGMENNGLVYTCRGGFIDIAHVRDVADMTFFLAMRLIAALPGPVDIEFATLDAKRVRVHVEVPASLLALYGRFTVAATIAEYLGYQQSTWHELAQWWGYESARGYSEQVSAFSPEDFYSNALGARLGGLAVRHKVFRSREDYNAGIDTWLAAALKLLHEVPTSSGRAAMGAIDGVWWSSKFMLPDNQAVPRRNFNVESPIHPWLLAEMKWPARVPQDLEAACADTEPRPLYIPSHVGSKAITDLATIEWEPNEWVREDFPVWRKPMIVRGTDVAHMVDATHRQMVERFQPGFDSKAAVCPLADLQESLARIGGKVGSVGVAAAVVGGEQRVAWQNQQPFPAEALRTLASVFAALCAVDAGEVDAKRLPELRAALVQGTQVTLDDDLLEKYLKPLGVQLSRDVSAEDGVSVLAAIASASALSARSRETLLAWMKETPIALVLNRPLSVALGKEAMVAHAVHADATMLSDLGLVALPNGAQIAISVMTKDVPEKQQQALVADLGRAIWQCWRSGTY